MSHTLVAGHGNPQAGIDLEVSFYWPVFMVTDSAVYYPGKKKPLTVLPSCETYELPKEMVWQDIPTGAIEEQL